MQALISFLKDLFSGTKKPAKAGNSSACYATDAAGMEGEQARKPAPFWKKLSLTSEAQS